MEDDILSRINDPEYAATLKQIESSHDVITELIDECNEMVTNIKIANDLREINRRKEDESSERARTSFLEEESAIAQLQFDEITSKWDPISRYNDSIDIYNACEEQKSNRNLFSRLFCDIVQYLHWIAFFQCRKMWRIVESQKQCDREVENWVIERWR